MNKCCLYIVLAMVLTSCLSRNFTEPVPSLSLDAGEIVVPADTYDGIDKVRDTLYVTSNRSWSVKVVGDADWLSVGVQGHQNPACISVVTPLPVAMEYNETDQDRVAELVISSASGEKKVEVVQMAKSYRLELAELETDLSAISADGLTFDISFICNTDWTLKPGDVGNIMVRFDSDHGSRSSTVSVTVMPNSDPDREKMGSVILSAKGCQDIEIPLQQLKWTPYILFEKGKECVVPEGVNGYDIPFKANVNWTAELLSVENYDEDKVSLAALSGDKDDTALKVNFSGCVAFGSQGKIVVRFSAEGIEETTDIVLTQNPAIRMTFGNLNPKTMHDLDAALGLSSSTWPFVIPKYSEFSTSSTKAAFIGKETEFILPCGYGFKMFSTRGFWLNSKTGFIFGGAIGDYFTLPVVEGFRLSRLEYTYRGTTPIRCNVCASDGTPLEGSIFTTSDCGEKTIVELEGAKSDVEYRVAALNTQYFRLGDFVVYYEQEGAK